MNDFLSKEKIKETRKALLKIYVAYTYLLMLLLIFSEIGSWAVLYEIPVLEPLFGWLYGCWTNYMLWIFLTAIISICIFFIDKKYKVKKGFLILVPAIFIIIYLIYVLGFSEGLSISVSRFVRSLKQQ